MDYKKIDLTIPAISWLFISILFLFLPESIQGVIYSFFTKIRDFIYKIYLKVTKLYSKEIKEYN
jgi:hypothetical protein